MRFVKVDTEDGPEAGATYDIRSIPTMALFHGGREVARVSGAMQASRITAWIDQHLGRRPAPARRDGLGTAGLSR